ncbi:MAG: hypothetical protein H7336_03555 [Bacteriovorax sp.]|nr:hypothetical protein [Bacteriovorax sp.]
MSNPRNEFQEIGHCGGKFTVKVEISPDGNRRYQLGFSHDRPTGASIVALYALPQGIPVGMIRLGGIGQEFNSAPFPNCFSIFIASDVEGKFGHECPECKGYWRSSGPSAIKQTTCPYCGVLGDGFQFLTKGQRIYIERCCQLIGEKLDSPESCEASISMDEVADSAGRDVEKPTFYYAEESQQKRFNCISCECYNDILGRFGYCSRCGKHNGLSELSEELNRIKQKIISSGEFENCLREAVAIFDSVGRSYSKQFAGRIPMTEKRTKEWERKLFHSLDGIAEALDNNFDIGLFKGFHPDDKQFIRKMFLRRHVYEHNGGVVDDRYIKESGDVSVRSGQAIRESSDVVNRTIALIEKMGKNLDEGFHSILKPN